MGCNAMGWILALPATEVEMKYGIAWLLGVPTSVIILWFLVSHIACGH
jgi:hypothetical protein